MAGFGANALWRSVKSHLRLGKRGSFLIIAVLLLGALVGLRSADPAPLRNLRNAYFDYLQSLSPRVYTPLPVVIVDLDELSLQKLGQWPWPRDRLAAVVDRLRELGAAVVAFDILFPEADRLSPKNLVSNPQVRAALGDGPGLGQLLRLDNDAAFATAIRKMPVILGISDAGAKGAPPMAGKAGFVFVGREPGRALLTLRSATAIVPAMAGAAAGIGVVNVNPLEQSDRIRAVPLIWQTSSGHLPGLAVEALRLALGETTFAVKGPKTGTPQVEAIKLGGYTIPASATGLFQMHYRVDQSDQYISVAQLLDPDPGRDLASRLKGSIVFVGASAAGLSDIRTTALGQRVPGVSIHAQVVEQILLGDFLKRNTATEGAEVLVFLAIGMVVTLALMLTGPVISIAAGAAMGAVALAGSWYVYTRHGILFDATFPLIGGFMAFSALAMFQFAVADRDKRLIRRSFAHYVAPSVLLEMDRKGHSLELGGKTGEVTVLFCDVRDFTPLAASMTAHDLVALLNELFTDLSDQILAQSGTIDKYIGDEIMAFWNAPVLTKRHQLRACLATLQMRAAIRRYNTRKAAFGAAPIAVGMGLDCGLACVGNIGSRDRFNYTAIGDTVNVAARTQTACRHVRYDILVTGDVARAAPELAFLPAGFVALKGVSDRTEVFILLGDAQTARTAEFLALKAAYMHLLGAIRSDTTDLQPALDAALSGTDPHLATFIRRCTERHQDFLPAPQAA